MTIEWKFPHNGFGQVRGVSDAGIETFTGTEIQSLAREICQNSLDAAVEGSNATIKVDFEQYRIPSSDIPGYEQYASKIQKAYDYWSKKNSEKTIKVLTKALNAIKKPTTVVLRISDFNTTGLSHPYEDSDEGWNALTKLDGGATKTGDKAGAFGIGKNAPFTNSDYRLVFYRTLNEDQETAAQGMSRFISFPEDLSNSMNTMTTGIGYYGNPEGNLPVDSISELEKLYQRSEIGTDVFVYGFNAGYEWNKERIVSISEGTVKHLMNYIKLFHNQDTPDTEYLFYTLIHNQANPMSPGNVERIINKYAEKIRPEHPELPAKVHPHMLRRTRATNLYQSDVELELVSRILGHASTQTTRIYAKPSLEMIKSAMDRSNPELNAEQPLWPDDEVELARIFGIR